ncbi:hypothetical protein LHJ74_30815 [Streptomyces sp. N2-109]|uniref:Uncharacterized protein n=1 Tax=Streptomyces gossypii TaxID=2883101 RepID=A0ABT2K441_9ACTN|nr:hypothetical protein [Streptomyces gossypii]MCT2594249.1 hypothetical protein [Streptomyces gossypii]
MSARDELFEAMTPTYATQYAPGEAESANAMLDAYRDEILREAADVLDARSPDPNPLASIFKPYVGRQMTEELRRMAAE